MPVLLKEVKTNNIGNERNSTRRRVRHAALPDYQGCEQTIVAHLGQADGVVT